MPSHDDLIPFSFEGCSQGRDETHQLLIRGNDEAVAIHTPSLRHNPSQMSQFRHADVVPKEVVVRVQRDTMGSRELESFLGAGLLPVVGKALSGRLELRPVPVEAVGPGDQGMVVLEELSVGYEDLAQIHDALHLVTETVGLCQARYLYQAAVTKEDQRAFDGCTWGYRSSLSGPLHLQLSTDGDEVVQEVHGGRMKTDGGKPGAPRSPVPQAEATPLTGMREDWPPCKDVLDKLVARLDSGALLLSPPGPDIGPQELPAIYPQLPDML